MAVTTFPPQTVTVIPSDVMFTEVYDPDVTGVVQSAASLQGLPPEHFAAAIDVTNLSDSLGTAALVNVGTGEGTIPIIPVPMSSMSSPVKATIDGITHLDDSAAFHEATEFALETDVTNALSLKEDVVTVDSLQQDLADSNNNFLYLLRWIITTFGQAPEGLENQIESALGVI